MTVWRSSFALSLFDLLYLQLQSPELSELLDLYTSFDAWSEGIAEAICSRFGKRTFHQLESLLSKAEKFSLKRREIVSRERAGSHHIRRQAELTPMIVGQ